MKSIIQDPPSFVSSIPYLRNIRRFNELKSRCFSQGGLISCNAGVTRPNVYGKMGCMSSLFWWDAQHFQLQLLPSSATTANNETSTIYIDAGTTGSLGGEAQCAVYSKQVYEYLQQEKGFVANQNVYLYIDVGGQHNEASWGSRFHVVMEALYSSKTV